MTSVQSRQFPTPHEIEIDRKEHPESHRNVLRLGDIQWLCVELSSAVRSVLVARIDRIGGVEDLKNGGIVLDRRGRRRSIDNVRGGTCAGGYFVDELEISWETCRRRVESQ